MDELRLFFAFDVPAGIKQILEEKRRPLIRDFPKSRWVRPEGQHLTLRFIGAFPADRIDELLAAVVPALRGLGPVDFSLHGGGFFPTVRRPRNAWIGGHSEKGAEAALRTSRALESSGVNISPKPWKLHLTQARFQKPWSAPFTQRFLQWAGDLEDLKFRLDEIILFSSKLEPGGARYTRLAGVSLL